MADRTRLAAAGLFLALTLAAIPALLPINLAWVDSNQPAEAAVPPGPLIHLRAADVSSPLAVQGTPEPTVAPEGVLRLAIAEAEPRSHTVTAGETLWKISQDAGVGVEALAAANYLTLGSLLHRGQVLALPPVDPASASAKAPVLTHEVAAGETLWGISRAVGVRVENLAAANHLTLGAVLHPGQALVVPSQDGSVPGVGTRQARFRGPAILSKGPYLTFRNTPLLGESWPLVQPSEGMITSRFGWRIHPIFGTREFHTGLDIANRIGTPVRAAETGIVRFVGWMGGYGRLIVVAHGDGLETSYSHLSGMMVSLGERVARGQVLGRMGSTGWSTGPHLLFEVRRHGVAVDPVPFLQGMRGVVAVAAQPALATRTVAVPPAAHPASSPRAGSAAPAAPAAERPRVPADTPGAPAAGAPASTPEAAVPSEAHPTATEVLQSPRERPAPNF
jgi:murein DD-endopeptidase MepM/ murein hydrolase activator NlpD